MSVSASVSGLQVCTIVPNYLSIFVLILCILVFCLHVISVYHIALGGQKRVLDPPELELQTAARCHMGAGNQRKNNSQGS